MLRAPDAQIAERHVALVVGVQVDAPVQPVARQEVDEKLGARQRAVRQHLADCGGMAARLQLERDGVAEHVPGLVAVEVGLAHVQHRAVLEAARAGVPHIGRELVGAQQLEQLATQAQPQLELAGVVLGQQGEAAAQRSVLSGGQEHGRPPVRRTSPAEHSGPVRRRQEARSPRRLSPFAYAVVLPEEPHPMTPAHESDDDSVAAAAIVDGA